MSDIKPLLHSAKEKLAAADISEVDAEHLFAYVLGISRMDLHNSLKLEEALKALGDFGVIEDTFAKLISRRAAHEPLQYLTGISYFRHLEIEVGPGVLVPRPESELLVEAVLTHIKNLEEKVTGEISVIDLGAGSGALSLAIATEAPRARVIAVEKSADAIVWLKKNVARISENVRVVEGDVVDVLPGVKCDAVIANPPYVPNNQSLPRDVAEHEPHIALFGGATGLELPKRFIDAAARLLKSGGVLAIEHTEDQGAAIDALLSRDFIDIAVHQDLTGRPRWSSAVRK
ncbi:MAG: peptide chain release factor N(5)-glutamine methyltransferase [Candidatus Planktophila sp.]|nr:peptide chain release factor N(5)-glutamine methyltransferase [Candidatus Planktophila sp.]